MKTIGFIAPAFVGDDPWDDYFPTNSSMVIKLEKQQVYFVDTIKYFDGG